MYYGVAAVNGLGVYTNYNCAMKQKEFLKKFQIKRHDTAQAALEWAKEKYNDEQDDDRNLFRGSLKDIRFNWINYRSDIRAFGGY